MKPDNWLFDLGTPYPTEEDLDFWDGVFEEYRRVVTKAKTRKTRGVIAKWLKDPYNDSAAYRPLGQRSRPPLRQIRDERNLFGINKRGVAS